MVPSCDNAERRKISPPGLIRGCELILSEEIIRQGFACAGEFPAAGESRGSLQGQVQQFQGPIRRFLKIGGLVLCFPVESPLDFASGVRHLLCECQFAPPARGESLMMDHGRILFSTIPAIFSRISALSTPRLLLFWDGRMLIMESYSRKSFASRSG
jgi:hypothetical protein